MRRAFTLTELVVVVAVIMVLAALLVPALKQVRTAAVATVCANNQRQVGLGFVAYAEEHDGQFPADSRLHSGITSAQSDAWYDRLPDYLEVDSRSRVFQCAGYQPKAVTVNLVATAPKSQKMNDYLDSSGRPRYFRPAHVRDAGDILLMVDAVAGVSGMGQWSRAVTSGVTDSWHRGRVNILAADGLTLVRHQVQGSVRGQDLKWLSTEWE
jgi:type II secretory pathway pseudopilin PulG